MERREEGRQNRWLSAAEAGDLLGVSEATIRSRKKEFGAKGIGRNVFFDRTKVEALKRRAAEADARIARLEKTHFTVEELARTLGMKKGTAHNSIYTWKLPRITFKHPISGTRIFIEKKAALEHTRQPTEGERPKTPEQRDRIVDAALDAYAKGGRDPLALHAALKTLTRGDIEKASVRYRKMLFEAREKLGEEGSKRTYTLGEAEEENPGEAEQRERAYAEAQKRHNDVLLKEGALREILERRRSEMLGRSGNPSKSGLGNLLG